MACKKAHLCILLEGDELLYDGESGSRTLQAAKAFARDEL